MYIVVSQCYVKRCLVFSQLRLSNYKQSHFALASSVAILRSRRNAAKEGLPGFDRRKVAERKFLCSNVQSLTVLSTKISGQ